VKRLIYLHRYIVKMHSMLILYNTTQYLLMFLSESVLLLYS